MQPAIRIEHGLLPVEQQHRVAAILELEVPPAPIDTLQQVRTMAAVSPTPQKLLDDADRLERNPDVLTRWAWSTVDRKRMHYESDVSSKSQHIEEQRRRKRSEP